MDLEDDALALLVRDGARALVRVDMGERDAEAGAAARDEAIARLTTRYGASSWWAAAVDTVWNVARDRPTFTTDDVWAWMPRNVMIAEPRAMGAVITLARREGWIERTDDFVLSIRAVSHRRPIQVWRSMLVRS